MDNNYFSPTLVLTSTTLSDYKLVEYLKKSYSGKWILSDYNSKADLKEDLADLSIDYPILTNILLGDLDLLSLSFQQALLKFLEEPPKNLHIFLTKKNEYLLLPTIKSRVRIVILDQNEIISLLDDKKLEITKKHFPAVAVTTQKLLDTKLDLEDFGDLLNIERDDLLFYLWQIEYYLNLSYTKTLDPRIAKRLSNILEAKMNLTDNLQKKISLCPLLF